MLKDLLPEFRINKKLLIYKSHYALFLGGLACITPFLPLIVRDYGISADVSGVIYTVLPFIGLVARPLVSVIADKLNKQKLVLLISLLIVSTLIFSINFIPPLPVQQNESTFITCNGTNYDLNICGFHSYRPKMDPVTLEEMRCLKQCIRPPSDLSDDECFERLGYLLETQDVTVPSYDPVFELPSFQSINVTHFNSCLTYRVMHPWNNQDSCGSWKCNENETEVCVKECFQYSEVGFNLYRSYQFWWLAMAIIIKGINMEMVNCIGDAVTYNYLGKNRKDYGKQRVAGTLGWGLMIVISSYLLDKSTTNRKTNYSIAFYLFLAFMLVDGVVILFMDLVTQESPRNLIGAAIGSLNHAKGVLFICTVFTVGIMAGVLETFLFWYLEDLGGNKLVMGVVRSIQCFGGEMPFIILSGLIINKIGYFNSMSLGLIAFGLRYVIYSVLMNPWYFLPVELLHGFCFGVFYPAATGYASSIAPPGVSTTLQGIVSAVYLGAGSGVGSLVGGILYKEFGGAVTFRVFGIVAFIVGLLVIFFNHVFQKQERKKDFRSGILKTWQEQANENRQTPTIIVKFVKNSNEELKNWTNQRK